MPDDFQCDIGSILAALEGDSGIEGDPAGSSQQYSLPGEVRTDADLQLRVALEQRDQLVVEASEKDAVIKQLQDDLTKAGLVRQLLENQVAEVMVTGRGAAPDDTSAQLIALLQVFLPHTCTHSCNQLTVGIQGIRSVPRKAAVEIACI